MKRKKTYNRTGWIITTVVLGCALAVMTTLFAVNASGRAQQTALLQNIYSKNFYDLVDNVNNAETDLAKAINSTNTQMEAKYLTKVSNNAKMASTNLENLPYAGNSFESSVGFINQLGGYTETLAKNLQAGQPLSAQDAKTLEEVYDSVLYMKNMLAKINAEMWEGYDIAAASKKFEGDNSLFAKKLGSIQNVDVEYPTMIYDGPFAESVLNKTVKGLSGQQVSEEQAKQNLLKLFTSFAPENVVSGGLTNGRFETYNFECKDENGQSVLYAQVTKTGGHLLTVTAYKDGSDEVFDMQNAKQVALDFCQRAGIQNPKVVWTDTLSGNAYINIASTNGDVILYPDLVKVKIDLATAQILGFEATNYYTNHAPRTMGSKTFSKNEILAQIPKKFVVKFCRLALIPLEYNQEVLTWEVACTMGGDEYYFYYNAATGNQENILKVIKDASGNQLI